ncbi:MAG: hypothetical protein LBC68_11480 [Prevotellaceae bacterium]|jgi:hypothetical protein|nr:hypothetical protein [Prevotellaceae bacterium]
MEDDINIRFEDIIFTPPGRDVNVEEREYSSLYAELKDKCNPDNFLYPNPYNKEKADIANEICLELENARNNMELQKQLRHRAIVELGIHFNSHALRDKLMNYANPSQYKFTEKFTLVNELYTSIMENGDNIEVLEKIQPIIERALLGKTISEIEEKIEREKQREIIAIFLWILGISIVIIIIMALIDSNK